MSVCDFLLDENSLDMAAELSRRLAYEEWPEEGD